jgi:hypothetical protein
MNRLTSRTRRGVLDCVAVDNHQVREQARADAAVVVKATRLGGDRCGGSNRLRGGMPQATISSSSRALSPWVVGSESAPALWRVYADHPFSACASSSCK